jgi:hypothetical protein
MFKKSFVISLVVMILLTGIGAAGSAQARPTEGSILPAPLMLPGDGSWGAMGTGMNGAVYALVEDSQGNMYAGGVFTNAGGVTVNYVAKWDGGSWSALSGPSGTGINNNIWALAVDSQDNFYAGGGFSTAGGVTVNRVAKWDGGSWSALIGSSGTGMSSYVYALAVDSQDNLYAGGNFIAAGGVTVNRIAKWDPRNIFHDGC